jgi:broad specificity phosphatase PhoE
MAMPRDLFLVRHGESEMNRLLDLRKKAREAGEDPPPIPPEANKRHEGDWPLTSSGQADAERAGKWFREHGGGAFDRYLVSDYLRTRQTAGLMGLPEARWRIEPFLRERGRGEEGMLREDHEKRYEESRNRRNLNPYYWTPDGGGESVSDVCLRVGRVLDSLWQECDGKRIVIVCHEEVIWAIRMRLEKWRPETYNDVYRGKAGIPNGGIIHFTRETSQGALAPHMVRVRLAHPTPGPWTDIVHRTYSNQEIMAP